MASKTTLTSLAMLKVNMDRSNADYVDYLRPFVLDVLRVHRPDPIQDSVVAHHIKDDFGLFIPNRGVHLVLNRLRRKGLLHNVDGVLRITDPLPDDHLHQRRADANRRIDTVIHHLQQFAQDTFAVSWSSEDVAQLLHIYLSDFAIECLRTYVHNTALPDVAPKGRKELRIIHSYVRQAHRTSAEQFNDFILLVKGHMLANALLCPDLQSLEKQFDRVTFFLDTPLILRALGLGSVAAADAANELLALVVRLRGRLAVFSHTVNELNRVLRSAEEKFYQPNNLSTIVRELRQRGKTPSDITLLRGQLNERLRALQISVRETPLHLADFQIDETALGDIIDNEIEYHSPNAKNHDIDCICSIFTLRRRTHPVRLEDANAVFVTTNDALARQAFNYGQRFEHCREVSAVITDFSLGNVAWLKAPLGAPSLPENVDGGSKRRRGGSVAAV